MRQPLPPLPTGTATLAPGPGGAADALAVDHSTLTVWQLAPGSAAWTKAQAINVPILYGSSSWARPAGRAGGTGTIRPELNAKPPAARPKAGYDSRWLCVVTGGARDVMDRPYL